MQFLKPLKVVLHLSNYNELLKIKYKLSLHNLLSFPFSILDQRTKVWWCYSHLICWTRKTP